MNRPIKLINQNEFFRKGSLSVTKKIILRMYFSRTEKDISRYKQTPRHKKYRMFLMRLNGKTYKEISSVFSVSDTLIQKIIEWEKRKMEHGN